MDPLVPTRSGLRRRERRWTRSISPLAARRAASDVAVFDGIDLELLARDDVAAERRSFNRGVGTARREELGLRIASDDPRTRAIEHGALADVMPFFCAPHEGERRKRDVRGDDGGDVSGIAEGGGGVVAFVVQCVPPAR